MATTVSIKIDESAQDCDLFKKKVTLQIQSPELFKYGIMMWEVPSRIKESDFDYLQSKVPHLESLISDFIVFHDNRIESISRDDRIKKIISEAIGVGIGLKYCTKLLNTNPNKFKKIGAPSEGKYLDYSTIVKGNEFEIETKGTVSPYYTAQKKDILEKKKHNEHKKVYQRFGTITMYSGEGSSRNTECVIVDDPPNDENLANETDIYSTQLLSYANFLSYILDSKYYNKYIRPLQGGRASRVRINQKKFFAKYSVNGISFYGECFDYRLIKENILKENIYNTTQDVFKSLTAKFKRTKFFIGLDIRVIEAINSRNLKFLQEYFLDPFLSTDFHKTQFIDSDGILIVKSIDGSDYQLESIFSEEEVMKRLGLYVDFIRGRSHKCGAPCKSRQLYGKPCEVLTYRTHCHFHR